ncbi:MAG: GIY-YIG nuclease family protein [Clostridiales Family XIII bacterium]|nr:GIY-YIG nuclease family protein [Clostridiales Family XIII bacterium]
MYIAECADGTLYTGYTVDIAEREKAHNSGSGAKYTRSRRPVRITHFEEFASKSDALRREIEIKRLRRAAKLRLISAGSAGAAHP